jgi:hypothetical protein
MLAKTHAPVLENQRSVIDLARTLRRLDTVSGKDASSSTVVLPLLLGLRLPYCFLCSQKARSCDHGNQKGHKGGSKESQKVEVR